MSPPPRILTGTARLLARPAALSASGATSAPSSKRASRSRRFTGWVRVRNFSKGIDFFIVGPRSLRIRMWIGFCPPSKRTRRLFPERAPAPLWPRPAVLPVPEPSPRPMRLRFLREPLAGFREWSPTSGIGHLYEMTNRMNQALNSRVVLPLGGTADLAQPERLERRALLRVGAVHGLHLSDDERRHQAGVSSAVGSSAAGCSAAGSSVSGSRPSSPSTSATVRPRSSATCFGSRSVWSASTVAFTRLIGFWLPSDFESTSWMPASSSTARTPPPAITPVPAEAGFSSTREAEWTPTTSWVIVEPCIGTLKRLLRARSTPFWIATGTSFALPYPTPTWDFSSPTTTSAVNEKRRPPLTTLATRLISTTRSRRSGPARSRGPRSPVLSLLAM